MAFVAIKMGRRQGARTRTLPEMFSAITASSVFPLVDGVVDQSDGLSQIKKE
jgi:hypothetical protein